MLKKNVHPYEDILQRPRHVSKKYKPMSNANRAAQFAPFAALSGHKDALDETKRLTEDRIQIDENKKAILDAALQCILYHIHEHLKIKVVYFKEDTKKAGGAYLTIYKEVKKIDEVLRLMLFMDGTNIKLDDIYEIEI